MVISKTSVAMTKLAKWIFNLVLLLFVFNGTAQSHRASVEQKIDSLFAKYNSETPGVSVVVVKDGQTIFTKGYGTASLEYNVPITSNTIFHVASVSKQFTAFSIYLLEEQGKISLEDDIRIYFPELPNYGTPIKIRHLLAHTSGLKDQWALLTLAGWRMDDVITTEQILKIITKQKELNFSPGTQYKYSNTGFTLLAEIVKIVSGKTFAEFTKENIFDPLKMNYTQFYDDNNRIVKNRAYSYGTENGTYEKRNLNYSTVGPTSLFTNVSDLSKWVLNFEKPIVGDLELIKRFNQISRLDNNEPAILAVVDGETIYHLKGQFMRNYKGLDVYNHTGSDAGFKSYLGRFQDNKLSIILLSNDENFASYKTGMDIAEFYLTDKFKQRKKNEEQKVEEKPKILGNANLKELEGKFQNEELASFFIIKEINGRLIMTHNRLSDVILTEIDKDKFTGEITFSIQVSFVRNKKGQITELMITNFGATDVTFNKIP